MEQQSIGIGTVILAYLLVIVYWFCVGIGLMLALWLASVILQKDTGWISSLQSKVFALGAKIIPKKKEKSDQ